MEEPQNVVPLTLLIDYLVQKTYHDLIVLSELYVLSFGGFLAFYRIDRSYCMPIVIALLGGLQPQKTERYRKFQIWDWFFFGFFFRFFFWVASCNPPLLGQTYLSYCMPIVIALLGGLQPQKTERYRKFQIWDWFFFGFFLGCNLQPPIIRSNISHGIGTSN